MAFDGEPGSRIRTVSPHEESVVVSNLELRKLSSLAETTWTGHLTISSVCVPQIVASRFSVNEMHY